ncbi:hypothetical protein [Pyrolobus fumarii]|uniref:hypothetical protein n=1 Tax=Pyrolobus fumarii TaxID=54252 RepID=UPI0014330DB1|nr:hypothetical protein [Pyrolobus fumarii]
MPHSHPAIGVSDIRIMHYGKLYWCWIDYMVPSVNDNIVRVEAGNVYDVLWSYESLCRVNVREVNGTHLEVWLSPANNVSAKLVSLMVYKRFNYAWLTVFNNTALLEPIFVGFTPIYTTLVLNYTINDMGLVYQGKRVSITCNDLILDNDTVINIWLVEANDLLSAAYGSDVYPISVRAKIVMPDGVHVIDIELDMVGINASRVGGVCEPVHYIDWGGLVKLLGLAAIPVAAFLVLRRARG